MLKLRKLTPVFAITLALGTTVGLTVVACKGDQPNPPANARDIALAPAPAPVVQPPLQDVPPPVVAKPAPKPPVVPHREPLPPKPVVAPPPPPPPEVTPVPALAQPAPPEFGVIEPGTDFAIRPIARLCTSTYKVGDQVEATVSETVYGSHGVHVPEGATAMMRVTEAQPGENNSDKAKIGFALVSVSVDGRTYDVTDAPVVAPPTTLVRRQSTGDQAKKIAAGAAIGAILGRVIGKSTKSTVGGAAVGAGGGAIVAAKTADYDACVAANERLAVQLNRPLRLHIRP
jgi:hypothetical protein